jgi:Flp pilus assembly protein TadB
MHRSLTLLLAIALTAFVSGCVGHVAAWEREKLAHPTMTVDELSNGLDGHVRAVSEGATGGVSGSGGGCGCN